MKKFKMSQGGKKMEEEKKNNEKKKSKKSETNNQAYNKSASISVKHDNFEVNQEAYFDLLEYFNCLVDTYNLNAFEVMGLIEVLKMNMYSDSQ